MFLVIPSWAFVSDKNVTSVVFEDINTMTSKDKLWILVLWSWGFPKTQTNLSSNGCIDELVGNDRDLTSENEGSEFCLPIEIWGELLEVLITRSKPKNLGEAFRHLDNHLKSQRTEQIPASGTQAPGCFRSPRSSQCEAAFQSHCALAEMYWSSPEQLEGLLQVLSNHALLLGFTPSSLSNQHKTVSVDYSYARNNYPTNIPDSPCS